MTKILVVTVFVLLILVGFLATRNNRQNLLPGSTFNSTGGAGGGASVSKYQPILSSQASIDVEVTPLSISTTGTDFKVRLTTHSGSLDFDLLKQSVLNVGIQKLKPLSWDGGGGGHHLLGTLKFPGYPADSKSIKLVISGVGVPERNFEWNI